MSGRVCVIIEHREAWDDYESYDSVIAVAGNPTIAENLIESYKNELIDKTYKKGDIATEMTEVGGDVTVKVEERTNCNTFHYTYYWTIEDFEIIGP